MKSEKRIETIAKHITPPGVWLAEKAIISMAANKKVYVDIML